MLYFARMKRTLLLIFSVTMFSFRLFAQEEAYEQRGEFGFTFGAAHYFGDLNPRSRINRPKPAFGLYFRRPFNNYLAARISVHYAEVGYSDIYSKNEFQLRRNLSFNSKIWEAAIQGDFNFFKYIPGDPNHSFTPFITIGAGIFSYDPYAYLDGNKVYLRPLGTEGQNISYVDASGKKRKPYGKTAICIPIGAGLKYNVSNNLNLSFQVVHRLTQTDYLDDVSTTYVGNDKFEVSAAGVPSTAFLMQDRSFEKGSPIGVEGRQRGWSKQKDQYIMAEIGISFSFGRYRCPSFN